MLAFEFKGISQTNLIREGNLILNFLVFIGGSFLFATIYTDDLQAKSLPSLIGFGKKRATILLSKFVVTVLIMSLMFFLALGGFCLLFTVLGFTIDAPLFNEAFHLAIKNILLVVAYSSISSVIVYATQKSSVAIVAFVLLATGFISQILFYFLSSSMVTKMIGDVSGFTINPIVE
ncbi:MAG: hypothetical protein LBD11_08210, partial [Candidatus Peribacteria bacterium]|nr:hypothetical protein [Candidatus Peribacteria bacterium]